MLQTDRQTNRQTAVVIELLPQLKITNYNYLNYENCCWILITLLVKYKLEVAIAPKQKLIPFAPVVIVALGL